MYMESEERVEIFSSRNFDFYFQILDNVLLNGFECRESPFSCMSIDAVHFGSYAMTIFACSTAYLIAYRIERSCLWLPRYGFGSP